MFTRSSSPKKEQRLFSLYHSSDVLLSQLQHASSLLFHLRHTNKEEEYSSTESKSWKKKTKQVFRGMRRTAWLLDRLIPVSIMYCSGRCFLVIQILFGSLLSHRRGFDRPLPCRGLNFLILYNIHERGEDRKHGHYDCNVGKKPLDAVVIITVVLPEHITTKSSREHQVKIETGTS